MLSTIIMPSYASNIQAPQHHHPPHDHDNTSSNFSKLSCQESYALFKLCSNGSRQTEGFNCSVSIATYMKCALNQCNNNNLELSESR